MKRKSTINFEKAKEFDEILLYRPLCLEEQEQYDKLTGYNLIKPRH